MQGLREQLTPILFMASSRDVYCRSRTISKGVPRPFQKHLLNTYIVPDTGLGAKNLVPVLREPTVYSGRKI